MLRQFGSFLSRLAGKTAPAESADALRADFKARYHDFKLLITANNQALEVMNDIEQALSGTAAFGMAFVRSRCTAATVNVLQMLIRMSGLSKGRFDPLFGRFYEIRKQIEAIVEEKEPPAPPAPRLVIPLLELRRADADTVGSKMAQLGEIAGGGDLPVPRGFAVTTTAYRRFMAHNELPSEIDRRIQNLSPGDLKEMQIACAAIQQRIVMADMPPELAAAIDEAYERLSESRPGLRVAVRSSALGEDMADQSFAGLYKSRLNVSAEDLHLAYREVVASKYGLSAVAYRLKRGLRDADIAMGVGCLEMVDAAAGGVMYSRHPVNPEVDNIFINAVLGLPKAVVDGIGGFDQIEVSRKRPFSVANETIGRKVEKFTCEPEDGVCREVAVDEGADAPAISHETAFHLADIALALEARNHGPQDIEWAVDTEGRLFVLQSRPMPRGVFDRRTSRIDTASGPLPAPMLHGGITACRGAAAGTVFIVKKAADMLQMPEGAVVVARQALPMWSPLVSRAAAVVTEEGGAAGHLAHITREFGVPAIFGVPGAVDRLSEGDAVTVDATAMHVYPGKLPLTDPQAGVMPPSGFLSSPVYQTLERAGRWIVPLNLLDPDSVDFTMANCRTLHDITRFIHEKSIGEMFAFGKAHRFPEKSAKQLVDRIPLKWWVLDLDDGFEGPVTGPRVPIDRIASIPMRALWEGIVTIPWEGPPPVDGKGLAAVMFRSTADGGLTPGVRSRYAARSYFMITRHYCSLNTRLGYHFCQVEALVGERAPENYIQFRFKGGAADEHRRLGRVHFIRDILESQEFHVEIRSDALTARVEKRPVDTMRRHLKTVGHLIIHTRQLDMIMNNRSSVRFYREKILSDLERLHAVTETTTTA